MQNKKPSRVSDLIPDKRNANKHSEFGSRLLENSIQKNGFGRSILISSDNVIIAGNGTAEIAGGAGLEKVRIIETNGKEIIAVKRIDIKSNTPQFYQMALADNVTAKNNIVLDAEVSEAIAQDYPAVKEWAEVINHKKTDQTNPGENLMHDNTYSITLKFTPEDHAAIKDLIAKSGNTAEHVILKALKLRK